MKPKLTINGREVQSREPKPLAEFANRGLTGNLRDGERARVSKGVDAFFSGDIPKATESLMQALNINPDNAEAHFYMGLVCKRVGAARLAIGYFTSAINAGWADSDAFMERGLAILQKRSGLWSDANMAMGDFEMALIVNPNEVRAHYYIGVCRHRMMDYREALASFEKYSELAPVDILAARELEIYRHRTATFGHYGDLSREYGRFMYG